MEGYINNFWSRCYVDHVSFPVYYKVVNLKRDGDLHIVIHIFMNESDETPFELRKIRNVPMDTGDINKTDDELFEKHKDRILEFLVTNQKGE